MRRRDTLACLLVAVGLVVRPTWSGPRCVTYEEKTLGRLQTLCADGTRAVSTWNRTLERWERPVITPPGQTCTGQMHPNTRPWEGRGR